MSFVIRGFGTQVPPFSMAQTRAAEAIFPFAEAAGARKRTLQALFRRSSIRKRHCVLLESEEGEQDAWRSFYPPAADAREQGPTTAVRMARFEEEAPSLAAGAGRRALAAAEMTPEDITHLVTISCTGFFAPGLDAHLVELLGLSRGVHRTHVGFMGCHGAMNGIRTGAAFTGADPEARVLVTSVELCTLHLAYGWDPDDAVANAIFGDGAAAVVGSGAPGGPGDWRVTANGTFLIPDSRDAMSWRIGDHGYRMTLSARVPDLIQAHLSSWVQAWLGEEGLEMEDVASWAVHPGGPRILTAAEEALGLDRSRNRTAREVLAAHGNMSSATILFILQAMQAQDAPLPLVGLAFGPGLVVEAVLVR